MLIQIRPATPQDVDMLLGIYERAYRGGYSACFDRYGAIGPEDFWWIQSEKSVAVVEINRLAAGLLVIGTDRGRMLIEELLLSGGAARRPAGRDEGTLIQRLYEHLTGQVRQAGQDRVLLRAAETNAPALAMAQQLGFAFVDALIVAEGAARQRTAEIPAGYAIVPAAPEHARQVAKLMDDLGMTGARPRRSRRKPRDGDARVWIAEREGYAAAVAEVRIRDGVGRWQVAVREAHRGKGLGGALAGTALEFCRTRHIKAVTTYWALDAGAARLAQQLGSKTERTYLYLEKRI